MKKKEHLDFLRKWHKSLQEDPSHDAQRKAQSLGWAIKMAEKAAENAERKTNERSSRSDE